MLVWMTVCATVAPVRAQSVSGASHVSIVVHPDMRNGKLVREVVVRPREVEARVHEPLSAVANTATEFTTNFAKTIDQIAFTYRVEASLVHSVIRAESNYNALALSNKGAMGMMQLIPATARRFGVRNPFDPRENVEGGVRYLRFLLDYFKNDYPKAIAAYNAGEAAVDRYGGIPPYPETRNYVYQVAKNLKGARQAEGAKPSTAQNTGEQTAGFQGPQEKDGTANVEIRHPIRASVASDGRVYYRTE